MLQLYKTSIVGQYQASLGMVDGCMQRCPDDAWHQPVANHLFCQSAFHALFFADLYLGVNVEALREQQFHRDNEDFFGDYEEMEDRVPQQRYDKESLRRYLAHCQRKASNVVERETEASSMGLAVSPGCPSLEPSCILTTFAISSTMPPNSACGYAFTPRSTCPGVEPVLQVE